MLYLLLLVAAVHAQLFTCNDTVTVCLIGSQTCCCAVPIIMPCQCCALTQLCIKGNCTAMSRSSSVTPSFSLPSTRSSSPSPTLSPSLSQTLSPSLSPTRSPSPSATLQPLCIVHKTSTTCNGALINITLVLTTSVVKGNLTMTSSTVLVISSTINVTNNVVVSGHIDYGGTVPTNGYLPLITSESGQLNISGNVSVTLSNAPHKACQSRSQQNVQDSHSFGVLVTTDSSHCMHSTNAVAIAVPVAVGVVCLSACVCVCVIACTAMLAWRRLVPHLWQKDAFDDSVIAEVPTKVQ